MTKKYFINIWVTQLAFFCMLQTALATHHHILQKKITKKRHAIATKNLAHKTKNTHSVVTKSVIKKTTLQNTAMPITALQDTLTPKVVVVTSVFKPSLRSAAKINLTAATAPTEVSVIPLMYNVPAQNLTFSYHPVAIKPLALMIDTALHWNKDRYIKVGYGNYATPYAEVGVSLGDGTKSAILLHGKYTSSKGNLPYQNFTKGDIDGNGVFALPNQQQLTGKIYFNNSTQYLYGFTGNNNFTKEQLQQQFNTVGGNIGLETNQPNDYGIAYHPEIGFSSFFDSHQANEFNAVIKAPISKTLGKLLKFEVTGLADITHLQTPNQTINNNLFYVAPALSFKVPNVQLKAGIQPSWDNNEFSLLPDIALQANIAENQLIVLAGWQGYYNKNTYQSLVAFNPFIEQPSALFNTKFTEQYAGIKGNAGKHFAYLAKISFLQINHQPLFANDTAAGKSQSFVVLDEPKLQALRLHGEISYTDQEKFSFIAGMDYTKYTQQQLYNKPWGLLPLDITGTLRYKLTQDFSLKSDLFLWDGSQYRDPVTLASRKLPAAIDMNAGAEFAVSKHLNLWLQFNNIFNNKYQRWNQYQVLGFNVLGGIVYSFH
jgi:hypothetical protein